MLPGEGGGDDPPASPPISLHLVVIRALSGTTGQTAEPREIPICLGLLLQASLKAAWANASSLVLQPYPALWIVIPSHSLDDSEPVAKVCWRCIAISMKHAECRPPGLLCCVLPVLANGEQRDGCLG